MSIPVNECKYRHFVMDNGNILTICSHIPLYSNRYFIGYAIFNRQDKNYSKKRGNQIAYERMVDNPIVVLLQTEEELNHHFLAWMAVELIFMDAAGGNNQTRVRIPDATVVALDRLSDELKNETRRIHSEQYENFLEDRYRYLLNMYMLAD